MKNTVRTKSTWKEGMRVESQAGAHMVIIDQPEQMGGKDAGANPMEYLLFSLGGCLAMMAAIIAKQERIDLVDFSIELEGDYDVDLLMGRTKEGQAGFLEIRETVFIDADVSDEEKEVFFEKVHERCPVTNTIRNQTPIKFDLK